MSIKISLISPYHMLERNTFYEGVEFDGLPNQKVNRWLPVFMYRDLCQPALYLEKKH